MAGIDELEARAYVTTRGSLPLRVGQKVLREHRMFPRGLHDRVQDTQELTRKQGRQMTALVLQEHRRAQPAKLARLQLLKPVDDVRDAPLIGTHPPGTIRSMGAYYLLRDN